MPQLTASPLALVRKLGGVSLLTVRELGHMGLFLATALYYLVATPPKVRLLLKRILFIGFQSIPLVVLAGTFTGMALAMQGYYSMIRFGSTALLGPMIAMAVVKELGPVITGMMVTSRVGSAITAELGIMRIGDEINALILMGLNPFRYLIVPTILAGIICLPLLAAVFDVLGILGGYLIGVRLLGVPSGVYFGEMSGYLQMSDIVGGTYKALGLGVFITWIACFKGYFAGAGAEGVSKATTQAVVLSSVVVLVWNYFMTSVIF